MSKFGTVTAPGTVQLERLLPGPIERIWAYLTEPDKRAKWLAGGAMELRVGGSVKLEFRHADLSAEKTTPERFKNKECRHSLSGRVTQCDPPRLLSYTWGDPEGGPSEVKFELTPRGANVLLVITHSRLPDRKDMVGVASGWDVHVGILDDVLNGREPRPFWTTHARLAAEYEQRLPL